VPDKVKADRSGENVDYITKVFEQLTRDQPPVAVDLHEIGAYRRVES
jgi:hypothetical protein